ncbi:MAG: argininosuccinate synthase, partial [Armatimonadota bacterium]
MNVADIIRKIDETPAPKVRKAAIAYSGGLDSSLGVELLRRKYGADEIVPITVDVGQGEEEVRVSKEKAKVLRVEPIMIDAREEFTEEWLSKAIRA